MNVMGLTRRNTIIGLGALAGGAGVIGATGAFTSVEADRTVSIEASGDGTALFALAPNDDGDIAVSGGTGSEGNDLSAYSGTVSNYVGSEGDTVSLTIDSNGVNLDAKTIFKNLLAAENNGTQAVTVYIDEQNSVYVDESDTEQTYGNDGFPTDSEEKPILDLKMHDGSDETSIVGSGTSDGVEMSSGDVYGITVETNLFGIDSLDDSDLNFPTQIRIVADAN